VELGARTGFLPRARRSAAVRRLGEFGTFAVFGVLPFALPIFVIVYVTHNASYGNDGNWYDLHTTWVAGRALAHGHSPYPFIYPAPAAVLMIPFGALPWRAAVPVFFVVSAAMMLATLRILGVRDWRCYGACLVALPTASALWIGTPTPMLVLATACAWRWRDRRAVVAVALIFAVATKIFLWPLFVWLLATRRFGAALAGLSAIAVATLAAWAPIGFAGLSSYPQFISQIASIFEDKSYSTIALIHAFGVGGAGAQVVAVAVGFGALAAVVILGRRPGGDVASFAAAIAAALWISPIVWVHYLVLLYIPIAILRPRLSPLWFLPLIFWVLGGQESHDAIPRLLFVLVVLLVWLVAIVRASRLSPQARTAPESLEPLVPKPLPA
jgi:alpha-1,2-mannosyltransferase